MVFNTRTTTHAWIQFLNKMAEIATGFEQELIICQQPTMFQTAESKRLWVQAATKEAAEGIEEGTWSEEEGDAYIENYEKGLTLGTFKPMVRNSGIIAVFTNALGNAIEQQSEKIVNWHTYAIFYQNRILAIYDPNMDATSARLDSCQGIPLVKGLVKAFRVKGSGRKVEEVWIGGGGNRKVSCQEMTRKWIAEEISGGRGVGLGDWSQREGWIKLDF